MNVMAQATIFFAVISGLTALANMVGNLLYNIFIIAIIGIYSIYTYRNIKKYSDTKTLLMKIAIEEVKQEMDIK